MADTPLMVAPVSRELPVADVERSIAFSRDVLGFTINYADGEENELTFGQTFE